MALAESLKAARERQADHEVAFTLTAMADLATAEAPLDGPLEEERRLLLERLESSARSRSRQRPDYFGNPRPPIVGSDPWCR